MNKLDEAVSRLSAELDSKSDWALKKVKTSKALDKLLNASMKKIFHPKFYRKIKKEVNKKIRVREANVGDVLLGKYASNAVAWVAHGPLSSSTIYIEKAYLEKESKGFLIKTILHEIVHILQNQKKFFFFFQKFPELREVSKNMGRILRENLKEGYDISQFFGFPRKVDIGSDTLETIAYIIAPHKLKLSLLNIEGKKALVKYLNTAKIFNLKSDFWKKRLRIS